MSAEGGDAPGGGASRAPWPDLARDHTHDPFRLALEAAPAGMLIMDGAGRIVLANAQIETLFGYDRSELIGQPLEMLVPERFRKQHPEFRAGFLADSRARPMGAGRDLYGLRSDGSEIPIEIGLNPLRTDAGLFVLSSVVDITERKRFEQQLRDQLRERDVLLQEIHHRVKNNLQVISSLISLQLGRMEPGRSYDALQECSLRVLAIAHIHEQLYISKDFANVPFSEYAHNLAAIVIRTTGVSQDRVKLVLDLKPISVAVDVAIPCGLILNELITNAVKHAFPGERSGSVRVEIGRHGADRLMMVVSDDGVGLPASFDIARSESLGMQLIQTLAAQVYGEFSFTSGPNGSRFQLLFPARA
jgi:PAS domain S-box-containing protein